MNAMVARKGAVVLVSAVLLLAVVITVNHDVRYHTSLPTASSSELLGVVPAAAKTPSKGQVFNRFYQQASSQKQCMAYHLASKHC
jgi:hypothetical protein